MKSINFMQKALKEAEKAYVINEVPIGAVVVYQNKIIGRGHNNRINEHKPTGHAEINALEEAGKVLGSWNLSDCDVYVTVEPCIMCAGALAMARVKNVYYGVDEPRFGAYNSLIKLNEHEGLHHYPQIHSGLMEKECKEIMETYFQTLRNEKVKIKRVENDEEFTDYMNIRKDVFVNEQNVDIALEIDEYDDLNREDVIHVFALYKDQVVGALRIIKIGKTTKIGRVCVLKDYRKLHIGKKLMLYGIKQAKNNGSEDIKLGAQLTAIPFYEQLGFKAFGPVYLDADIKHRDMIYPLNKQSF